jgi:V8-like Glu-specific endopeptidase
MKSILFRLVAVIVLLAGLFGAASSSRSPDTARQEVGEVFSFRVDSPRPAPLSWKLDYSFNGAAFVRLHFLDFDLAQGDKLLVSSPDGRQMWEYTGRGLHEDGEFWSFAVEGDQVSLELVAPSGRSNGFTIGEVGYGTVPLDADLPAPMIVVGDDGREPVTCHLDDTAVAAAQSPVARLLFTVKKSMYLCTGELVRGKYGSTLITNQHCIDSQEVVDTLEARFNYQQVSCEDPTLAVPVSYAGKKFLKTNSINYRRNFPSTGLDYTLLTLRGSAESNFGELIPTSAELFVGDEVNFIQHPGGRPKEVGFWEDAAHTIRCTIAVVAERYVSTYPASQIAYGCDSEGGSSGSAITRGADGKMVGLHHYGGVEEDLNSATMMSLICADAGELLVCDED